MKVAVGRTVHRGRAVDLRDVAVDPDHLLESIRDEKRSLVTCPRPGPVHSFVGHIAPEMHLSLRAALAAAARSRGLRSEHDEAIQSLDAEIDAISVESVDLTPARRRVAETGADVASLREQVAHLRGRLEAEREAGRETDGTRTALQETIAALGEAETDELAAEQALAARERDARAVRDRRDRRLSLVDERDNLARRARSALARRVYPRFRRAITALPVDAVPGERPAGFTGDPSDAALAVARIARLRAPVVLETAPFSHGVAARAALDAPVVLV